MNMREIRDRARELAKGACRVCPVCDGRACAGEVPGMGGIGSGMAFRGNVSALAALRLNTRLVHGVRYPKMAAEVLGFQLSLPLIIAPIGGMSFNMGQAMSERDFLEAIGDGAVAEGIVPGWPDSAPMEVLEASLACAKARGGLGLPFIKPWEIDEIEMKMALSAEAGCRVVGCDIDSAGLITLRRMNHPAFAKTREQLTAITESAHRRGLKFVVKGLMCVEDAVACLEAGVDGIVVSNHGGRVLDHTPGTAEVLPAIAAAVRGRLTLIVDGGIRTGVDILKMLALGADCVMIGRPYTIAAVGGGREGVALLTQTYKEQLEQAMIMTGCADVAQTGPHLLYQ